MEQPSLETEHDERPLPTVVDGPNQGQLVLTPNELRSLKAETGKAMEDLMGEGAEDADRMQALVWLALRRLGFRPTWDDAADVGIRFGVGEEVSDPSPTATSEASPPSAASGG